jgi:hypothetical protein
MAVEPMEYSFTFLNYPLQTNILVPSVLNAIPVGVFLEQNIKILEYVAVETSKPVDNCIHLHRVQPAQA